MTRETKSSSVKIGLILLLAGGGSVWVRTVIDLLSLIE